MRTDDRQHSAKLRTWQVQVSPPGLLSSSSRISTLGKAFHAFLCLTSRISDHSDGFKSGRLSHLPGWGDAPAFFLPDSYFTVILELDGLLLRLFLRPSIARFITSVFTITPHFPFVGCCNHLKTSPFGSDSICYHSHHAVQDHRLCCGPCYHCFWYVGNQVLSLSRGRKTCNAGTLLVFPHRSLPGAGNFLVLLES